MVSKNILVSQPFLLITFLSLRCLWWIFSCFNQRWSNLFSPFFHCVQVQSILISRCL